jgi:hypothetical protein
MGRAHREHAATANRPETETRSVGNVKRQMKTEPPRKVLKAGQAKMSEMEPGAILEISDEAAQQILKHRATRK